MANDERLFVDKLAEVIRRADGNHDMGAGALADAIADSGLLYELEQAAEDRGYEKGRDAGYAIGWDNALDAAAWDRDGE